VTANGKLANPKSRWAGMMRRIESSDFETANVEFIQFWMMDPFNSDNPIVNHQGGDLYFNLGNISEDILRDARRAYENGLPSATNTAPFIENNWGRIPTSQAIVNAFDNDPDSRSLQDVGFDGLRTVDEQTYFQDYINNLVGAGVNANAVNRANSDPSADDFHYFRGDDYDAAETSILNRYKEYNGPDGNSPVNSGSFVAASTNLPDDEDVNRDNTLDDFENYYQYKVKVTPNGLQVGKNYIVDKVTRTVTRKDNSTDQVTWYQFKIPIRSPDKVIGSIQDFNSIRFIRMFMTNFEDSTVLRMARLELVRGEWRRYQFSLLDEGEQVPGDDSATVFDILTVNLEENGDRTPINYVIPNGIDREINPSTNNLQQLNEQSLVLRVCNLKDGDARAAYKNTEFDMRLYKRLKMFIHAEAGSNGQTLNNGDITCFIRLGADFNTNFYEYEITLSITPSGTKDADLIWPEGNALDLELSKLIAAKTIRNKAINIPGSTIKLTDVYQVADGKNTIRIKGSPNLGNVRTIMIGIRNPDEKFSDTDDGLAKCAEVWVNELRMTDFDEKGGWAANARITAKLADFGTVTLTGGHQTIGFGGIEQKLQERRQSDLTQYDLSTTLQLGKFFGDNVGLSIPMYFGYAESFSNPRFNPLDPDVEFSDAISDAENTAEIKRIKKNSQEYMRRKGLNFTNVRKNKVKGGPPRPWDISNLNATYAFTETYRRDIDTQYDLLQNYKVALGYNYNTTPKNISPFQKSKLFKKKAFTPIRDFNFYLTPSSVNFRTDIDRQYGERLVRSNNDFVALRDTFFNKSFNWTRLYDFKFDLTKSLQFDFNANNIARIDEPAGKIDKGWERDSIRESFRNLGRNINYSHSGNARYNVPLNKFPILNWVNVNTQYGFDYSWTAAPLFRDTAGNVAPNSFGNTIQNSNTVQLNGQFNMVTLYNKVPLFKKVNRPPSRSAAKGKGKGKGKLDKKAIAATVPAVQIVKEDGTAKTKKEIKKEERKRRKEIRKLIRAKRKELRAKQAVNPILKPFVRLILAIKNMSFTYSETNGTALPGYVNESQLLGQDLGSNSPGLPFAFGSQEDVRSRAARDGWLTGDSLINSQYTTNNTTNFTARTNIEPIPGFRIDLNANRTMSNSLSEFFRADATGEFQSFSPVETGNFSMSFLTWNTAFINDRKDFSNKVFDNFTRYRETISKRLAQMNPNSSNAVFTDSLGLSYRDGYGPTQQEVLTYAFIAAYKDDNPETSKLNPFPKIPIPNWRVTYDGLSKMPWAKKLFNNISLSHGYRSSYNINSFRTNISYSEANGGAIVRDNSGSFIPQLEIQQISISEQFAPLLGVDITWKNSLFTRVEFKKDRSLSLTFTGIQMTEIKGDELTIGVGYRLKKFTVPFKIGGKKVQLNNDLNLSADVSIRRNKTVVRRMQEQTNVPTAGLNVVSIKTAADYIINDRFNIRFFYDRTVNTPLISTSFPTATTNAGVSIRFTLTP
ncbi:MAG: cell surface protein SprA, partial [Bacteroidia bacterium]|nr:cell surface protein SprA [Bacteroidia bacterium]